MRFDAFLLPYDEPAIRILLRNNEKINCNCLDTLDQLESSFNPIILLRNHTLLPYIVHSIRTVDVLTPIVVVEVFEPSFSDSLPINGSIAPINLNHHNLMAIVKQGLPKQIWDYAFEVDRKQTGLHH